MNVTIIVLNDLVAKVEDKVLETYVKAEGIWQRRFELPRLLFDLHGRCAGRAYCRDNKIRLNPVLLAENQNDFIEETVLHKVAHLLTDTVHVGPVRVRPHGPEWKSVMQALGLKPTRCHNYDVTNAQVHRERKFTYVCACCTTELTARTHFRLLRGDLFWYECGSCHKILKLRKAKVAS